MKDDEVCLSFRKSYGFNAHCFHFSFNENVLIFDNSTAQASPFMGVRLGLEDLRELKKFSSDAIEQIEKATGQ